MHLSPSHSEFPKAIVRYASAEYTSNSVASASVLTNTFIGKKVLKRGALDISRDERARRNRCPVSQQHLSAVSATFQQLFTAPCPPPQSSLSALYT